MPELPEAYTIASQLNEAVVGARIISVALGQPKCLNLEPQVWEERIMGQRITGVVSHGKWIRFTLERDYWYVSLGMGGELLLLDEGDELPEKRQAVVRLDDGRKLCIHFWWFGYLHLVDMADPEAHAMTATLGPDVMSDAFDLDFLTQLLQGSRAGVKNILLDQKRLAGIGNMYSHDILWTAGIHPLRAANTLSEEEIKALYASIRDRFEKAIALGGSYWEVDIHGQHGGYDKSHMQIGYRSEHPCPRCGGPIEEIRTGSRSAFVCPICQPLE